MLGQSASIDTAYDLVAATVLLRQHTAVGDVYTTTLTTSGYETFGQVHPFPSTLPPLPLLSPITPGTRDLTLSQNGRERLSPGSYGEIRLRQRSVLELDPGLDSGTFHFAELELGEESRVEAMGPVEVRIAGRLLPGAKSFLGVAPGGSLTAKDFRLEVHGQNGASGNLDANPEAATFGQEATVRAVVLVANGTARMRQKASLRGVLFGRDVELGQDATVTFEDGWNQPPIAHAGGPYSANEGQPITLSALGATDREGGPLSFAWDLDADGVFDDATGATPTHTFPNDGVYPVAVLVTDPLGASDTATTMANIANLSPSANADLVRVLEDAGDVVIAPLENDFDWDALSILRFTQPSQGAVTQVGSTLVLSLPPNFHGILDFEATITDGVAESTSIVTVVVDPVPDAPVASDQSYVMLEDTELVVPPPGLLERAEDADLDVLLLARITSIAPAVATAEAGFDGSLRLRTTADFEGIVTLRFVVTDGVLEDEASATITVLGQNDEPQIVSAPPTSGSVGELLAYSVAIFDPDLGDLATLSIESAPAGATLAGSLLSWTPDSAGDFSFVLRVTDTHGASTLQTFSVHVVQPNRPPHFVSIAPRHAAVGQRLDYVLAAEDLDPNDPLSYSVDLGPVGLEVSGDTVSFVASETQVGTHPVVLRVTDLAGSFGLQSFDLEVVRVPVDPALVAPPIDLTVATSVYEANRFLIEGSNPIQVALAGAVNPRRALLLRGRALLADETPVVGALVSVPGQPDVGTTLTRLDGSFDLLVNGGGLVSVRLEKAGLISVDRSVDTVWQETYVFSDVVMTAPSPGVSVDFTAPGPKLVSSANASGRRTSLFFGSNAAAFSANDASVLTTIRAHVSEFETPATFSAPLPPASGYSFMAELEADQARDVVFANDVYVYVDDTLNLPAGRAVPAGSYRRDLHQWVPAADGRTIRVLGTNGFGLAEVDTDGDGLADEGVGPEERQVLASLYPNPAGVWRVPVGHFSTWAFGFSTGGPADSAPPVKGDPVSPEATEEVIERSIELTNTSFRLVYQSDRVVGFTAPRTLEIPVSGVNLPVSLDKIDAEIFVAGRRITQTFGPTADQKMDFVWDGKDAYGRSLQGGQPVRIRVAYEYPGTAYVQNPTSFLSTFAQALGRNDFVLQTSSPSKVALVQEWRGTIGGWDARSQGLGGWWLDVHHVYDPGARILYEGNGTTRKASALGLYSETVAGTGNPASTGDGGPAAAADIFNPVGIVSAPDGTVYFTEGGSGKVRKIAIDGSISTILSPAAGPRTPLLQNGSAEQPLSGGLIPGWTQSFGAWSLGTSNPAPFEGAQYFEVTDPSTASLTQELDLSPYASAIDAGSAEVALSGTLAARNGSLASASVFFLDEFDTTLDGFALGQVGSLDGWKSESDQRFVPVGARKAVVFLQGESNGGFPPVPSEPVFITVPEVVACENQTYAYNVQAVNSGGINVDELRLNRAPPAADILLQYLPSQQRRGGALMWWGPTTLGKHPIEIEAIDDFDGSVLQTFEIDVVPCPTGPIITSNPVTRAARMYEDLGIFTTTQTYDLVVDADQPPLCYPHGMWDHPPTNPVGLKRCSVVSLIGYQPTGPEFSFVQAPLGATIDPVTGIIEWDESSALPDVYTFEVAVGDRGTLTFYDSVPWPAGGPVEVMFDAFSLDLVGGGSASSEPAGLAVTQDGSVLVADKGAGLVLAIRPSGNVETIAGGGSVLGDGGPAASASLDSPTGIAVGPDGAIYVADTGHHRVRRIGTDGVISTLAGIGSGGFGGDGGAASQAQLDSPKGVAVDGFGAVYVADTNNHRVRRVGADGNIETFAGSGVEGFAGDGAPAGLAALNAPEGVAVGKDGAIFVADTANDAVRVVGMDAKIETVMGGPTATEDGFLPASRVKVVAPKSVWVAPDNDTSLFVADSGQSAVRRVALPWKGFDYVGALAVDIDARQYLFDALGKHIATKSASTATTQYTIVYGPGGYLSHVVDPSGIRITLERDGSGVLVGFIDSEGHRDTATVDADSYLVETSGVLFHYKEGGVLLRAGEFVFHPNPDSAPLLKVPGIQALGATSIEPCFVPLGIRIVPEFDSGALLALAEAPGYGETYAFVVFGAMLVDETVHADAKILPLSPRSLSSVTPGVLSFQWDATNWVDGTLLVATPGEHHVAIELQLLRLANLPSGTEERTIVAQASVEGIVKVTTPTDACSEWLTVAPSFAGTPDGFVRVNGNATPMRPMARFVTGVPKVIFGELGGRIPGDRIESVREFVRGHPRLFGATGGGVLPDSLSLLSEQDIGGLVRLVVGQSSGGRAVFGRRLVATFDSTDQLVTLIGRTSTELPTGPFEEDVDIGAALAIARNAVVDPTDSVSQIGLERRVLAEDMDGKLVPSYQIAIDTVGSQRYRVVVSAVTGEVLYRRDLSDAETALARVHELDAARIESNTPGDGFAGSRDPVELDTSIRVRTPGPYEFYKLEEGIISETFFFADEGTEGLWVSQDLRLPSTLAGIGIQEAQDATTWYRQVQRFWDAFGWMAGDGAAPLDLVIDEPQPEDDEGAGAIYNAPWILGIRDARIRFFREDDDHGLSAGSFYKGYHEAAHHLDNQLVDIDKSPEVMPATNLVMEHRMPHAVKEGIAHTATMLLDPYPVANDTAQVAVAVRCLLNVLTFNFHCRVGGGLGTFRKPRTHSGLDRPGAMWEPDPWRADWPDCRLDDNPASCHRVGLPPAEPSTFVWSGPDSVIGTQLMLGTVHLDLWETAAQSFHGLHGEGAASAIAAALPRVIMGALLFVDAHPSFHDWMAALGISALLVGGIDPANWADFLSIVREVFGRHGIDEALGSFCGSHEALCQ
ncbi:MAG: cadherin-like domain-containing protein [Deltaproteobacteria bacterium]|nr:cadherin-like domain-containing protein [Deltaproteobacteria bacterium]